MRVIFLDMDGVLNSDPFLMKACATAHNWPHDHVDPELVARFDRLVRRAGPDVKVVLSSTWRLFMGVTDLTEVLRANGYTGPEVADSTPSNLQRRMSEHVPRHKEIRAWRKSNKHVGPYVILDDTLDAGIKGHFVHTDYCRGLTDDDVERALEILKVSPEECAWPGCVMFEGGGEVPCDLHATWGPDDS